MRPIKGTRQNPLETVVLKLCEQLPLNLTFFEKNGLCQVPRDAQTDKCRYCRPVDYHGDYFCHKKTYTTLGVNIYN